MNLILASILIVWLNRTLTDTPTFVGTVAPLIEEPEVQQFIAKSASEGVVESAPVQEVASKFLSEEQRTGKRAEQLKAQVQTEVENRILKVVSSPDFAAAWRNSIESTHSTVVTQLESGSETITFDFSPVIKQAVDQLAKSDLGINPKEVDLGKDTGKISMKRSELGPVSKAYDSLQSATVGLLIAALVAAVASVLLSTHHIKTLRRVLLFTGVFSLIIFIILNAPSYVKTNGIDPVDQAAIKTMIEAVFSDLKNAFLVVAIVSIAVAFGSKIAEKFMHHKPA